MVLKQSQVMADWNGIVGKGSVVGGYGRRSMRDNEDFEEEDIWSVIKEREDSCPSVINNYSGSSSSAWRFPSTPRMMPKGNSALIPPTTTNTQEGKVVQESSAPVNIPDWSKIYGKSSRLDDDDDNDGGVYNGNGYHADDINGHGDADDDDDDDMVPPHEWIARKLARSQISSFSVCEGIGRTLKGRDLSEVRNAILTKTGFLE